MSTAYRQPTAGTGRPRGKTGRIGKTGKTGRTGRTGRTGKTRKTGKTGFLFPLFFLSLLPPCHSCYSCPCPPRSRVSFLIPAPVAHYNFQFSITKSGCQIVWQPLVFSTPPYPLSVPRVGRASKPSARIRGREGMARAVGARGICS